MLAGSLVLGAVGAGLGIIFIQILDRIAYLLLANSYAIFRAVAAIDIFGTTGGNKIFTEISNRVYNVIFILAVFVISYQLLMYIINPDKNKDKVDPGTGHLFKELLFSIVLVIMCPLIFKYMAIFQEHVLQEGTVQSLITGQGTSPNTRFTGKGLAISTYIAVYHPNGTDFNTYFEYDEKGGLKIRDQATATAECMETCGEQDTCDKYYEAMVDTMNHLDDSTSAVATVATNALNAKIVDGDYMEYYWVLATVVGLYIAWFFASYTFDLGTRAVKLGVLQLIAPIPILLKPFQKGDSAYKKWFKEITKTYVEIFLRIAVVYIVVELYKLFPSVVNAIFDADNGNSTSGGLSKGLAFIVFIFGILKFAKEAPDLFKNLFSGGGNWLAGLDLKPGVKRRVENNTYAMKGISAGVGALSGFRAGMGKATHDAGSVGSDRGIGQFMTGLGGGLRGIVHGTAAGIKNSSTTLHGMSNVSDSARNNAHIAQQKHQDAIRSAFDASGLIDQNGKVNANEFQKFGSVFFGKGGMIASGMNGLERGADRILHNMSESDKLYHGEGGIIDQARIDNLNMIVKDSKVFDSEIDGRLALLKSQIDEANKAKATSADGTFTANFGKERRKFEYNAYDARGAGWYATDGDNIRYEDYIKESKRKAVQSAGDFNAANVSQLSANLEAMERHIKGSNMSNEELEALRDEFNSAAGLKGTPNELTVGNIKDGELAERIISQIKDSDGKINQEMMAAALMGMKAMGDKAGKYSRLESTSIQAQQQIDQNKKDENKK